MFLQIFDDAPDQTRGKVMGMYAILIPANIAAWLWALLEFRNNPLLLSTAFLAYSLGLRHAFDADHIAAIDNITRKLMQEGRRPIAVGFFFSLGVCAENSVRIDYVTESPNVSGDDRAVLPPPDPVRLALQVEEPTGGRECSAVVLFDFIFDLLS
jgi:hypothetical protein